MSESKIVPLRSSSRGLVIAQLIFCIIDKVAQVVVAVFHAQNRADAKRAYLNMQKNTPNVNPDDFILTEITNINDNVVELDLSKIDYTPVELAQMPDMEA